MGRSKPSSGAFSVGISRMDSVLPLAVVTGNERRGVSIKPSDLIFRVAEELCRCECTLWDLQDEISPLLSSARDAGSLAGIQNLDHVRQIISSIALVSKSLSSVIESGQDFDVVLIERLGVLQEIQDRLFRIGPDEIGSEDAADGNFVLF